MCLPHVAHILPKNPESDNLIILSIPNHNPIKHGTLRAIIRDAGLTVDEFTALL